MNIQSSRTLSGTFCFLPSYLFLACVKLKLLYALIKKGLVYFPCESIWWVAFTMSTYLKKSVIKHWT